MCRSILPANVESNVHFEGTCRRVLQEDVAFFAVLAEVEAFDLFGAGDSQSHDGVQNLQDHECCHDRHSPRDHHGDDLGCQHAAALQEAERLAVGKTRPVARVANTPVKIAPSVPPTP